MIVLWLILALAFTDPQQSTPTPDEQATMQRAQLNTNVTGRLLFN